MKPDKAQGPKQDAGKVTAKIKGKGPVKNLAHGPASGKTKGAQPTLTARQRLFCAALLTGKTAQEAYRAAGYVGTNAAAASRILMRRPQVAAHLALLHQANQMSLGAGEPGSGDQSRGKVSERELIETLNLVMRKGLEKGTLPPVVSAASLFAKICGFDSAQDLSAAVPISVPEIHIHFLQADPCDKGDKTAETD